MKLQVPSLKQQKYGWLLASFFVVFLVLPFTHEHPVLANAAVSALLIGALSAVSTRRGVLLAALALLAPSLVGKWAGNLTDLPAWMEAASAACQGLFLLHITLWLCKDVFLSESVTRDRLRGSVCVYLLLGMIWASGYQILESLEPGSFVDSRRASSVSFEAGGLIYFSYVTLSTVGYGDITPTVPSARFFAALEALTGQVYLAIMVARLMGLYLASSIAQRAAPKAEREPDPAGEPEVEAE